QLTGDPVIVNNDGDVILQDNFNFDAPGQDLAILASGNIFASNDAGGVTTINLSGSKRGGNLTLVAGFDFDLTTNGEQTTSLDAQTITLTAPFVKGGSIYITNLKFDPSSSAGDAGNVTIVAHGGTQNEGVIILGSNPSNQINASAGSNGYGGNVLIIGHAT